MGTGLFVYTSNRLEELAEALATVHRREPPPPLAVETILVPSQGLARWLRQDLAQRFGIAAGLALPFPGAWLQQLERQAGGGPDGFAADVLRLRLWRLLAAPALRRQLAAAADYCGDDPDQRKRWQLADRLARTFDDYQLYRPELLAAWAGGDDTPDLGVHAAWQAVLWRELRREAGLGGEPAPPPKPRRARTPAPAGPLLFRDADAPPPPPTTDTSLRLQRLRRLLADRAPGLRLPERRLSVFGAGTLPPALLELFGELADRLEVHLFVPAPTSLYAGDQHGRDPDGNALFARLGTEAREFADLLAATTDRLGAKARATFDLASMAPRPPLAVDAPLLQRLQDDLANLRVRTADGVGDLAPIALAADDDSVRVHVCHSPQRELEVVRDQILAALHQHPQLEPHEILVLVPDIAVYAPYAHAVFGPVHDHLPFHVADKSPAAELPLCATLFAVLALAAERLEVHDVLHLLEQPAVQQRFGIGAGELPLLRARCERAGIRWGLDGAARERQFGVPPFEDNAWLPGLHRLLLGVATGPVDDVVLGTVPVADVTAGRDELLARFLHFTDTLWGQLAGLQRPQPPAQWADRLEAVLAALFAPEDPADVQALELLRTTLVRLREQAEAARCSEPMHRTVLRDWLEQALGQVPGSRGFLAGAVTVAALLPMRAVPVRRLFVCGLDDASFPRRDRPVPFDLIAAARRPGDRSVRLDDRQMFLDVLLAARDALHLTYVGRSQKDNSPCAPSPVLAELLDHLDRSCRLPDGRSPRARIVVEHPLQPWSRRYRDRRDPRLFTYTRADLEPPQTGGAEPPWFETPLTPPAEWTRDDLPLAVLEEFWHHPARFFLRRVAGVTLRRADDPDDTMEPFQLDPLQRWQLQDEIVRRALRELPDRPDPLAHTRAEGRLPIGGRGDLAFADAHEEAERFVRRVRAVGELHTRAIDVTIGTVRLRGELPGVGADVLVYQRMSTAKAKDRLRAWIRHVVVNLMHHQHGGDWPRSTLWLARDADLRFPPLDAASAAMFAATLLRGFQHGLTQPLPMLPETSAGLVEKKCKGADEAAQLLHARETFLGDDSRTLRLDESHDPDIRLCWRGRDPLLAPGFRDWAISLWEPIHELGKKA